MNARLSLRSVLALTGKVYVRQSAVLLPAAACVTALVYSVNRPAVRNTAAVAMVGALTELAAITLFTAIVVQAGADVRAGRPRRLDRLVRESLPMFGELLLVGLVASVVFGLLFSIMSSIVFTLLLGAIVTFHVSIVALLACVGIGIVVFLVPGMLLMTAWSIAAPIVILERPGRLRALRRSRALVRGSRLRVLTTILFVVVLLTVAVRVTEIAALSMGQGLDAVARLILGMVIAPIPILLATTLYFELLKLGDGTSQGRPPSGRAT